MTAVWSAHASYIVVAEQIEMKESSYSAVKINLPPQLLAPSPNILGISRTSVIIFWRWLTVQALQNLQSPNSARATKNSYFECKITQTSMCRSIYRANQHRFKNIEYWKDNIDTSCSKYNWNFSRTSLALPTIRSNWSSKWFHFRSSKKSNECCWIIQHIYFHLFNVFECHFSGLLQSLPRRWHVWIEPNGDFSSSQLNIRERLFSSRLISKR